MSCYYLIFILCCRMFCVRGKTDYNAIMSKMDITEKIGQMVQIDISKFVNITGLVDYSLLRHWVHTYKIGALLSSPFILGKLDNQFAWNVTQWREVIHNVQTITQSTNLKIPILYGIDSAHGASFVKDAALFPQSIAIAATFDRNHAYYSGKVSSKDTRASGIPWLSAPVLGLGLNPLWARFPETFGEDMYLTAEMGVAMIKGMQEVTHDGGVPIRAAACMKHFIAYSDPVNGHDRSPVMLPDRSLRQLFVPAFKAAIDAGVMTTVQGHNEVGGVPMASSKEYLKTLLRQELNFTGLMVTNYEEIENLHNWHSVADTQREAVRIALTETSIDLSMVAYDSSFNEHALSLIQSGEIQESRIDESVLRILKLKDTLGLFDTPVPDIDDVNVHTVGQDSDWQLSLDAARDSITLLKNDRSVLPLSTTSSVFLTGPTCNSLTNQAGGWSFHWQGAQNESEFSRGETILNGMQSIFREVIYLPGPSLVTHNLNDVNMTEVYRNIDAVDSVVVCIGEGAYAEKPGDINDLALPQGQIDYITSIRKYIDASTTPNKPIIMVIVSGRPRLLHSTVSASDVVLNAYLPGPLGGQAVGEIIGGVLSPSGRLPYTYPRHAGNIPYAYHHKPGDALNSEVEWEFGRGLSYTTFTYTDLTLSRLTLNEIETITISVTVTNTGVKYTAKHSVLMFLYDMYRRVTPEYKLLKRFDKIELAPQTSHTFSWTLSSEDFEYVGVNSRYVLEAGGYQVGIGADVDCRSTNSSDWKSMYGGENMCRPFELTLSEAYHPVCDYGCALWSKGLCGVSVNGDECNEKCVNENWSWNYVDCLQQYAQAECINTEDIQCYDAFSMNTPTVKSDSKYSTSLVLLLVLGTGILGIIVGSVLSVGGYKYVKRKSLYQPLIQGGIDGDNHNNT